jgi:hypothetical protein
MSTARSLSLTRSRRIVCDLMHFARRVPTVMAERLMHLGPVVAARAALAHRPCWFAILAKAYAGLCRAEPRLRRSYRPFPWPHLHEHAQPWSAMPISREVDGEEGLLFLVIREPDLLSLADLDARIRNAKSAPLPEVRPFRGQLLLASLPWPLRRLAWWLAADVVPSWGKRYLGTFGVTGVPSGGTDTPLFLSPLTTSLTMGVLGPDGSAPVRMLYDHRVLDACLAGRSLARLEEALLGPITAELRGMAGPSLPARQAG